MQDAELCLAWRISYLALQQRPGPDHPVPVSFRAAVLDALQTRHPVAFATWLNNGARIASDPARFPSPAGTGREQSPRRGTPTSLNSVPFHTAAVMGPVTRTPG